MKKLVLLVAIVACLLAPGVAYSQNLKIFAQDITFEVIRTELRLSMSATKSGKTPPDLKCVNYSNSAILIDIKNTSNRVVHINPNYFTAICDNGYSYSYSSKTYEYARDFPWINEHPLGSVKLLPGTKARGYLLFKNQNSEEQPQILYFDNGPVRQKVKIIPPKKVK
jgi:hypothetical protein